MANRVCLGRRANNDYGLFVAPSGGNALSDSDANLLFSTKMLHGFSVHTFGQVPYVAHSSGWHTVNFPTLPYVPMGMYGFVDSTTGSFYFAQNEAYAMSFMGDITIGGMNIGPEAQMFTNQLKIRANYTYSPNPQSAWTLFYVVLRIPGGS